MPLPSKTTRMPLGLIAALAWAGGSPRGAGRPADTEWVHWVVVNVCPARITSGPWRSDELRSRLHQDFDPDVLDWWSGVALNRGDYFTMRGVASSSPTAYEYQEAIGPMWGFARTLFKADGMAYREDGTWARFPRTKYGGAHMMCLNAPKWRHVVEQGLLRAAALGNSVSQDNIGCPVSKYHPGFCSWCNRRFVDRLRDRFPPDALRNMGIPDLQRFGIRPYLAAKRRQTGLPMWKAAPPDADADALIRDPIIHEYIRFQYTAMLDAWRDLAGKAKGEAIRLGRASPALYGNQAGCAGQTPLATMLSPSVDVVWVESSRCLQPCFEGVDPGSPTPRYNEGVFLEAGRKTVARQAWSTLLYKAARAAGHFQRPVWALQYPEQWFGAEKRLPSAVVFAEAHANGGVPVLLFGPSITQKAAAGGLMWQANRAHARFVGRHRALFTDRSSVADVALVLSLPSVFWRSFSSLRTDAREHLDCFTASARELEERHVPYEVLVLGHPDLYDDRPQLERLEHYRTVVLPHADSISDRQAEVLRRYAEAGGRLLLLGECATRDEELRPRPAPAFPEHGLAAREELASVDGSRVVVADLPATVWLNVWRHGVGPMTSVQMVNYDLDLAADRPRPVTSGALSLRADDPDRIAVAWLIRPGADTEPLDIRRSGDRLAVTVPVIDLWAVVVFAAQGEWETRSAAAEARKWLERLKIAARCPGRKPGVYDDQLAAASATLDRIQGPDAVVTDFAAPRRPLARTAEALRACVDRITTDTVAEQAGTRQAVLHVEAVRKFDFGGPEAPAGWLPVGTDTAYEPGRGYGWESTGQMTAVDDGEPDALHRDYIRSRDPAEYLSYRARGEGNRQFKVEDPPPSPAGFRVDLPDGQYTATLITGTWEAPGLGSVAAEGEVGTTYVTANGSPVLLGKPVRGGRFDHRAFRVAASDGTLRLRFSGANTGPFFHNTIEWLVTGLIIQHREQQFTTEANDSLRAAERSRAAAIREWAVLGPLPAGVGRTAETIPAARGTGPPSTGDAGGWRILRQDTEAIPGIDLGTVTVPVGEGVVFAATRVHCSAATEAVLHLSTSQTGTVCLNGEEALVDGTATGLLPDEHRANVRLKQGWNSLLVRCVSRWRGPWRFWAGLTAPDGGSVVGVRITADPVVGQ